MVEIAVAYCIGIDGGGSKTTCAVGDETTTLASATAGPSNITRVGEARARESIHTAIREACEAAKVSPQEIKRACIGAAGAAREEVAAALRRFTAELVNGEVVVVGDMAIALEAAFGSGPGVIVIAGTGSIAYGRDAQGTTARAGGWGFAISDEGSAHWIGRRAVSMLLRAADEYSARRNSPIATPLCHEILSICHLDSLEQLAAMANSNPDFAALFPAVLAASDSGDATTEEILEDAAVELARLATIIMRRLFADEQSSAKISMAMAGGVFHYATKTRDRFYNLIRATHPQAALSHEIVEPVYGALQMARKSKP